MPRTATAEPGIESSHTKMYSPRIASLTIDERLTDLNLRLRDSDSSQNMDSLPWEDAE
jgi:hypothetical protein